jgi:hypothetical protein
MSARYKAPPIWLALFFLSASLLISSVVEERPFGTIPPPEILGVRLAMPYRAARAQLAKIGQLQKEEEGQEVWRLLGDKHYAHLVVGFNKEKRVRYVTALAEPMGTPVKYTDLGDLSKAARSGQPGNLTYTWKGRDEKDKFEYLAIAKGKEANQLSSFSVKRLGARGEEDD